MAGTDLPADREAFPRVPHVLSLRESAMTVDPYVTSQIRSGERGRMDARHVFALDRDLPIALTALGRVLYGRWID